MMAELLNQTSPLNKARQQFSFGWARIEQACAQRKPPSSIEIRHMEFEVVIKILKAFGVDDERTVPLGRKVSSEDNS